jgi:ATP-binding cassette subfamily B protein
LICLARALAVEPKVLILDEATSSIDPATERKLQTAIECLQLDRTSFVVAHRLSTIRRADQILVIDQGVIVQKGSHDELKSIPGIYADLLSANAWNTATA